MELAVPPLEVPQPIARVSQEPALPRRRVEVQRRRLELVEDEHHRPQQQDEELHGDLQHGVEHEAEPALAERCPREVALDLRLVGAEVRKREEEAPEQPRPERVPPARVDREVDPVELAEAAGQGQGVRQAPPRSASRRSRTTKAASIPQKITPSWYFCVKFTAWLPPAAV